MYVNKFLGILLLIERLVGYDKLCIICYLIGVECFLGIVFKGELVKFLKGGVRNGLILWLRLSLCLIFLVMGLGLRIVDK